MFENTPDPGIEISDEGILKIVKKFIEIYRRELYEMMPDNVPTACTIDGVKNNGILSSQAFKSMKSVYVLFDSPFKLLRASGSEVCSYVKNRNPWEDYDFCVFDESLKWAIGITHDDDVIVSDKDCVLCEKDK